MIPRPIHLDQLAHQGPVILALKCYISRRDAETQRKNILKIQNVINPEGFFTHFFAPLRLCGIFFRIFSGLVY